MSGELPSVAQERPNGKDTRLAPREETAIAEEFVDPRIHERTVAKLRIFWDERKFILRAGAYALLASTFIAVLIPSRYESVTRLMPPDGLGGSGLGLLSLISGRGGAGSMGSTGGLGGIASDLMGVKSSGALFVGVVQSQTVQDRLIKQFNLMHVYHDSKIEDARKDLVEHTDASEDRKSGIVAITVTDRNPKRAASMAQSYVDELGRLVAQVSTSSARRERIFLEQRL